MDLYADLISFWYYVRENVCCFFSPVRFFFLPTQRPWVALARLRWLSITIALFQSFAGNARYLVNLASHRFGNLFVLRIDEGHTQTHIHARVGISHYIHIIAVIYLKWQHGKFMHSGIYGKLKSYDVILCVGHYVLCCLLLACFYHIDLRAPKTSE